MFVAHHRNPKHTCRMAFPHVGMSSVVVAAKWDGHKVLGVRQAPTSCARHSTRPQYVVSTERLSSGQVQKTFKVRFNVSGGLHGSTCTAAPPNALVNPRSIYKSMFLGCRVANHAKHTPLTLHKPKRHTLHYT